MYIGKSPFITKQYFSIFYAYQHRKVTFLQLLIVVVNEPLKLILDVRSIWVASGIVHEFECVFPNSERFLNISVPEFITSSWITIVVNPARINMNTRSVME